MRHIIDQLHSITDNVVFGNGWLALGTLAFVVIVTVLIRVLPGIRV